MVLTFPWKSSSINKHKLGDSQVGQDRLEWVLFQNVRFQIVPLFDVAGSSNFKQQLEHTAETKFWWMVDFAIMSYFNWKLFY